VSAPEYKVSTFAGFVVQKNRPIGGDAVHTLHEFLNSLLKRSAPSRESLGVRERAHGRTGLPLLPDLHLSHPSFSLRRPFAALRPANGDAVTITIGGRSPPTRFIGRGAWRARSNGARRIRATGSTCASTILRGRNATGSANSKETKAGGNAFLPTTTQLQILPTTSQLSRKPLNLKRRQLLAHNSPLVKGSPSAPEREVNQAHHRSDQRFASPVLGRALAHS
jgi:hypothetical protein